MENYGILLVDDEQAYQAIVSAVLAPFGGAIACASAVKDAVEAVEARRYDLILLDIELAADTGYRAVAAIRAAAEWARLVPIIAFTTLRPSDGLRHFIEEGFDGWLPKPFQAGELVTLARHWLGADRIGVVVERPGARLNEIIGSEQAEAMIRRLFESLAEAVRTIDAGGEARALGHRLGGLAGTLGFAVLSAAWLALQNGETESWPTVRTLTLEAIDQHTGA